MILSSMTKPEAIQDAKDRMERTGLIWCAIKIKLGWFKYTYDTVSIHHQTTHKALYKSGKFKVIDTFEPETGTEVDLSYLNLDRKTKRKLGAQIK